MSMAVFMRWDYEGFFAEFARRGTPLSALAKRVLLENSNRAVVNFWHRIVIPKHFELSAATRYRYQGRKEPYKRIKVALAQGKTFEIDGEVVDDKVIKGGTVSMVRSGRTESKAERKVAVFASAAKGTVKVVVPRYVAMRRKSDRPNQSRELQTVTAHERHQFNRIWAKNLFRGVRVLGAEAHKIRRTQT